MTLEKPFLSGRVMLAFCWLSILLVVSQVVGQEGAAGLEGFSRRVGMPLHWAAIVGAVALGAVVLGGYLLTRPNPRPGMTRQCLIGASAFTALILSNAVPDWGFRALGLGDCPAPYRLVIFLLFAIVWGGLWCWMLPVVQGWFQTPVDLATKGIDTLPEGPVTLIALVSRIEPKQFPLSDGQSAVTLTRGDGANAKAYPLAFTSLAQDIEALQGSKWPWQQLLRAVSRYAPRPGLRILLVGSRTTGDDDRGSHEQLATLCKPFLDRYPELRGAAVDVLPQTLDFEDFNEVKEAIRHCIREQCGRVAEGNVFVDITGGQKVASAAAAAATIGTMGQFQYVRTNDTTGSVVVSDLHPPVVPTAGN
jgi:hypothetical protein